MQRLKDKYNIMASENKSEEKEPKPAAPKPVAKAKKQKPASGGGQALTKEDLVSLKKLAESMIPTLKGSIQNVENQRIKHAHKKPAIRDSFNEKIDTHIKNYEGHIEFLSKYL